MRGGKCTLVEHCSFKTKNLVTRLHIEAFVMNNKPIICCGTKDGEIYLYEVEWEIERDPNYGLNMKKMLIADPDLEKTFHHLKYSWSWNEKGPVVVEVEKSKSTAGQSDFYKSLNSKMTSARGTLVPFKQESSSSPLRLKV